MSDEIIDTEWSELAIDDGTVISSYNEYDIVIGGDEAEEITTTPTSINYSPSINKAKNITLDVPPDSVLEDLTYLGEDLELYIDGQYAFGGEIYEIETQQREGGDYTIHARPPGKKLNGSDFERTINNGIFVDVVSNLVDEYNEFDDKHDFLVGTEFETRNNVTDIGGNVLTVDSGTTGTVTFSPVGQNSSEITSIYVKAFTENAGEISLSINSTNSDVLSTYVIEDSFNKNRYGEWVRFDIDIDVSEEYELEFELNNESVLIDWISVVNESVYRETRSPEVEAVEENIEFYSRSGQELEDTSVDVSEGIVFDGNGRPQTRQVTEWGTSPFPESIGDDEFVDGVAGNIETGEVETRWQFSISDDFKDWSAYARVKPYEIFVNRNEQHTLGNSRYDASWSGAAEVSTEEIFNEDSSVKITDDADKRFQWVYNRSNVFDDLVVEGKAYIPSSGLIRWVVEAGPFTNAENEDGYELRVNSSNIELNRLDDGSTTTLDSDSFTQLTNEWVEWSITIDSSSGVSITFSDSENSYSLSSGDDVHDIFGRFRVDTNTTHYLDDLFGDVNQFTTNTNIRIEVDGEELSFGGSIDADYREFGWEELFRGDFNPDWDDPISGSFDVYIEADSSNETGFVISPLVLVHEGTEWNTSNFDNELNEPEGHLDFPTEYASGEVFDTKVRFLEEISDDNIFRSTVDSDVNTEQDIVSLWGPSQVIDVDATSFRDPPNQSTATDEYAYPGVQHAVQYTLSSGGIRDSDSPRTGINRQRLNSYNVQYSINDLEVMFDRNLSDNRLALMNGLAEDSSVLFRWEGNKANIFHRGQKSTNIDLRSEEINSSVSIEDVYSSCEVIGLHNVRSGVIESSEAPDFVDSHKVIRTEDIETEVDAKNRARRFLENHGSIQYKGDISTLPTFAPLGSEMNGHLFNHGQDMIIQNVRYSKRGTDISLGYSKNIANELIAINDDTQGTKTRTTSRGMTLPVGNEQI